MLPDEVTGEARAALVRMGLLRPSDEVRFTALTGGVSSVILRADTPAGVICFKRALAKLQVESEWFAPIERSQSEVRWIRFASRVVPDAVPTLLGEDPPSHAFAMAYLDPGTHPVWKGQLRDGVISADVARAVGATVAMIHAVSADEEECRRAFANDSMFHALRIEPYLLATRDRHADCAAALDRLADVTSRTRHALVHGDVSPKNILIGATGPILLDAECAWFGDPAFDLAFCLNHLLLKCVWRPSGTSALLACYDALCTAYLERVRWEPRADLDRRAAALLPALLLARIDGRSPVEYITRESDRDAVRRFARTRLLDRPQGLAQVRNEWEQEMRH